MPRWIEQRDHGPAAGVEARLDHHAGGLGAGVGLQLLEVGEGDEAVEQLVEVGARLGGHVRELGVPAPVGRRDAHLGELAAHAVGVGPLLVDLVDRDHDRHAGGLGVVDRLARLRHHAVVCRDHDHGDVGDLRAARAHGGERLVAGRVEEGDGVAVVAHLVGADVLGDAARLARGHLGLADGVQQRGLAVVDVAHDRDHRRALHEVRVGVLELGLVAHVVGGAHHAHLLLERVGEHLDGLVGERLGERGHLAQLHRAS